MSQPYLNIFTSHKEYLRFCSDKEILTLTKNEPTKFKHIRYYYQIIKEARHRGLIKGRKRK